MQLFYSSSFESDQCRLEADEMHHCIRVLRHVEGDEISVTDGHGLLYRGRIEEITTDSVIVSLLSSRSVERSAAPLWIVVGLPKKRDRIEFMYEKLTEFGVHRITPVLTARSERDRVRLDRLEKICLSAMKQTLSCRMPLMDAAMQLSEFWKLEDLERWNGARWIGHCEEKDKNVVSSQNVPKDGAVVMIGPEGDFSPEEIGEALSRNFTPIDMGDRRLRTETAAIFVATYIYLNSLT